MADTQTPPMRYSSDRVNLRGIGLGALAILGAIAFAIAAAFVAVHVGHDEASPPRLAARLSESPPISGPVRLQPDPAQDIALFRAQKQSLIDRYEWVDREHGIARIPIDRAMALLAEQGASKTHSP